MRPLVVFLLSMAAFAADGFVSLMPKKDVTEHWTVEGKAPPDAWSVRNGVIACTGQPNGFLRSKKVYRNFTMRAEWRFQKGWEAPRRGNEWPNAGFFIHAREINDGWPVSLEVQGYYGEAGSLFGVRGGKITGAKRGPFVKDRPPFGEWDRYEITSHNGKITIVLNGVTVNEGTGAYPEDGNVCLQSEGWPVFYRNVAIKELK
jgi:3-keto-disaccharide hydrolase